jgi:hypothetical protein
MAETETLAERLRANHRTFEALHLGRTAIGPARGAELAAALQANRTVKDLDLEAGQVLIA